MRARYLVTTGLCAVMWGTQAFGAPSSIAISPDVPPDIPGGAANASLMQAGQFAWQEFIALNWAALAGTRDTPDDSVLFGDPSYDGPLVWHTYRHKVEIYPGQGTPPGFVDASSQAFGYDAVPPQYIYNAVQLGQGDDGTGEVPPCSGQVPPDAPSFINLDEISQIGFDSMMAGAAPVHMADNASPQLIRFLAKANQVHYTYVADRNALEEGGDPLYIGTGLAPTVSSPSPSTDCSLESADPTTWCTATENFKTFAASNPTPTEATLEPPFVSFPSGTIHVKSAWRELTDTELDSGRYYVTTVRYYEQDAESTTESRCYREAEWGLVGLHIEHKTPTAPTFIFATFEQADNLQTSTGTSVENVNGKQVGKPPATVTTPDLDFQAGTATEPASLSIVGTSYCQTPDRLLYYREESDLSGLPSGGPICQNARTHPIPNTIVKVNKDAHKAISSYNTANGIADSVWKYYMLVNVQYQPFDLSEVSTNSKSNMNEATYYNNNEVIETDYTLSHFSGQIDGAGLVTNYPANFNNFDQDRTTFQNVLVFDRTGNTLSQTYNMGGCMGCHGVAQVNKGTDFSFILSGSRVAVPETPDVDDAGTTNGLGVLEP